MAANRECESLCCLFAQNRARLFSPVNKFAVKLETEDHGTVFVAMGRMETSNEFGSTTDRAWACVMKVEGSDRFPVTKCTPIGWGVDY